MMMILYKHVPPITGTGVLDILGGGSSKCSGVLLLLPRSLLLLLGRSKLNAKTLPPYEGNGDLPAIPGCNQTSEGFTHKWAKLEVVMVVEVGVVMCMFCCK
jgi:hypothetical protein